MSKGQETRTAILDEALQVASRVGFNALTIGQLAEQTQMSKSGLFAHFKSKEALQLGTLGHARGRFVDNVIRPALATPRGEARVRELFERWLVWTDLLDGGCVYVSASAEFDDQPGVMRDALVADQRDWMETLASVASTAVTTGDFRDDLDVDLFAFQVKSLMHGYHHAARLLGDERAADRTRAAFDSLLAASRKP